MKKELDELASAHKNLTVHYAIDKPTSPVGTARLDTFQRK